MKIKKILSIALAALIICIPISHSFASSTVNSDSGMVSLSVSQSAVTIKHNGASAFLDVIAKFKDGSTKNVNELAEWKSKNQDIAIAYDGRILAMGKGITNVTVSYKGFTQEIKVKVTEYKDLEAVLNSQILAQSLTESERDAIINKASAMYNTTWVPTQNLTGWRGNYTYYAGNTYRIPYSQTAYQKDDIGFNQALGYGDFYSYYVRYYMQDGTGRVFDNQSDADATGKPYETIRMPKYGNDCSAFVSFAFGVSRNTTWSFLSGIKNGTFAMVGSYNVDNPTYDNLISSYQQMQRGDAITNTGHAILIGANYSDWCICYEQTPYQITITTYDHTQLANNSYRPFAKK